MLSYHCKNIKYSGIFQHGVFLIKAAILAVWLVLCTLHSVVEILRNKDSHKTMYMGASTAFLINMFFARINACLLSD